MARQIDWSEPLSDEDRAWAAQRPDQRGPDGRRFEELIAENDEKNGRQEKQAAKSRAERLQEIDGQLADLQNERERLLAEQAEEDRVNTAAAGDPDARRLGLGFTDNTYVDGDQPEGAPEPVERYEDEKVWTKDRLQAEIDQRNKEREEAGLPRLARTGTRSELVERLMQDDREAAESEEG